MPSVARIRHLYSTGSPAVAILFFCDLDFIDATIHINEIKKIIISHIINTIANNPDQLKKKKEFEITSFESNPNGALVPVALKHACQLI